MRYGIRLKRTAATAAVIFAIGIPNTTAKTVQVSDYELITTAQTESKRAQSRVSVDIYADGFGADDLTAGDFENNLNKLVYHDQVTSGENGEIVLNFKMNRPSGNYTIVFGGEDRPQNETFFFANKEDYKRVVNSIISAKSEAEVQNVIGSNLELLGFKSELFEKSDLNRICSYVYKELPNQNLKPNDDGNREKLNAMWKKAVVSDGIIRGEITDVTEYASEIGADRLNVSAFFEKSFIKNNSAFKTEMTGKIKADMPQSLKEFDESVTEQLVLTAAHLPDGAQNLKDVLDAFGERFGIENCSLSVCQKIMGVYYKDMSALKAAIENAKNSGGSSESGGSKGGSGSGGFGGGGIGKTTTDTTTVENPKPVDEITSAFDDIAGVEWAREAINYLAAKGIVSGKADKTFAPNDNITREEFVKILVSAFEITGDGTELDFSDVSKDDWFYPYLSKAVASGVVSGYDNGRFGTGDCITRQDICVMIQRIMQKSNVASEDSESNSFGDFDDISEYARESVSTMSRLGIVSGNENKMFLPHDFATRAETAKMVYKAVTVTE